MARLLTQRALTTWGLALGLTAAAACSNTAGSPTGPSSAGTGSSTAGADGTTLKATAPTTVSPRDRVAVDSLRPTLRIDISRGKYVDSGFGHRFELYEENTLVFTRDVPAGSGGAVELTIPEDVAMQHARLYRWRARAQMNDSFGPWSSTADFVTPNPPSAAPGAGGGGGGAGVSAQRSIGVGEALGIIMNVHNSLGYHLGSGSSREDRVDFLWTAVAVIHYGHPRFNPAGGDPSWCVKDAGGGRPPSDDVLVQCGSREAWDLIGGAGANGYSFHLDHLGRLDGGQNVYPPPASALPR